MPDQEDKRQAEPAANSDAPLTERGHGGETSMDAMNRRGHGGETSMDAMNRRGHGGGTSIDTMNRRGLGGGSSLTSMMHTGLGIESPFMREIYLKRQCIVGTRYQGGSDELVEDLKEGSRITFLREPDNEFDSNAIMALDEQGRKLGYIPKRENELMAALMGVGKYFYGVITDPPRPDELTGRKTPFSIWMDLYMREFARPGDLSEIPLLGYKGSFVVVDFTFAPGTEGLFLSRIYAIKIIRGEERGSFAGSLIDILEKENEADTRGNGLAEDAFSDIRKQSVQKDKDRQGQSIQKDKDQQEQSVQKDKDHQEQSIQKDKDRQEQYFLENQREQYVLKDKDRQNLEKMVRAFIGFTGHLPIVTFDILGRRQECLEETFDMAAGRTFSNHVIDILQMAQNHIPEVKPDSLQSLADYLGIYVPCEDPREERCRIIWQLYCRMERSELDKKNNQEMNPDAGLAKAYGIAADLPLADIRMTDYTRKALLENKIDTLRELCKLSEQEISHRPYIYKTWKELKIVLDEMGLTLRPEDEDPFFYGYPDHIKNIFREKGPYWKHLLYFDLLDINLLWLQPFRKLSNRDEPFWASYVYRQLANSEELEDLLSQNYKDLQGYVEELKRGIETAIQIASGKRKEDNPSQAILRIIERQMDLFKTVIHWIREMKSIEVMPDFTEDFDEFIQYGFEIRDYYDELHRWAIHQSEKIKHYRAGKIKDSDMEIAECPSFGLTRGRSPWSIRGTVPPIAIDEEGTL